MVESEEMRQVIEKGNFLAITARTARAARAAAVDWTRESLSACEGVDAILVGIGGLYLGLALAEKLRLPLIQAHVVPFTPTRAFSGALLPLSLPGLGARANWLTHHLTRQAMWQGFRAADARVRQQVLGLPPAPFWGPFNDERMRRAPVLYGISPSVIPKPGDWDERTHVTGYWFLEPGAQWGPPASILSFLEAGPPPVYIGFGSMGSRHPEETAALVVRALELTGQRAILGSGWGGLRPGALPASIMVVDAIPHAWLFPQTAAVVHHGGAGTTAAGLRAGVPSLVIPFFGDQAFWGRCVAALGAGPPPIPRRRLSAEGLAAALEQVRSDDALRTRASALGKAIREEDGVGRAVAIVEQWADR